ncbi:hypothetical protein DSO57_1020821 [Entomophthora muscae]|uniref:Uncharacterized protein n=1 Tax=Entomophthora muscae TaxID=34485 RepID=A0ACC2SSG4_9FUNG|nr:hypothetical protein DSO57_1020821 [Entomophthora muscae]
MNAERERKEMSEISQYTWLFGITCVWACIDSYGIGANDVANSFSTSVGAKTLTLKQACMIASVTEMAGAYLLGANTASTLSKSVIKIELFKHKPELLMLAMFCALVGSSTWTLTATRMGWPVSTSHAIIGALIGVGIAGFGPQAIIWGFDGVARIVSSWFISPLAAGLVASVIFVTTRSLVLKHDNSFERGLRAIPIYFGATALIDASYVLLRNDANTLDTAAIIKISTCVIISLAVTLFCWFMFVPFIRRKLLVGENLRWFHVFVIPFLPTQQLVSDMSIEAPKDKAPQEPRGMFGKLKAHIHKVLNVEIHQTHDEHVQRVMDTAERYDPNTEYMYSILQIATACMSSFAHGSNDIANAVGPLSTVYHVWSQGRIPSEITIPSWVLLMGGLAMDVGLLTYGYKIFQSLGAKITYLSPSRGFSMELGTSLTVVSCSRLGLPVSTTHCITGATAAVGLCNGSASSINWRMLGWCFFSWFLTLPAAGCTAGLVFFLCSRSPVL